VADWGFNSGMLIEDYTDAAGGTVLNSVVDELTDSGAVNTPSRNVMVYPNPFNEAFSINFENDSPLNQVSAELFDIYGRKVMGREYKNLPTGLNRLNFEFDRAANGKGIYLLALKVNGKLMETFKLIKQ
jgi:hypothetical protein